MSNYRRTYEENSYVFGVAIMKFNVFRKSISNNNDGGLKPNLRTSSGFEGVTLYDKAAHKAYIVPKGSIPIGDRKIDQILEILFMTMFNHKFGAHCVPN